MIADSDCDRESGLFVEERLSTLIGRTPLSISILHGIMAILVEYVPMYRISCICLVYEILFLGIVYPVIWNLPFQPICSSTLALS
jgi:hypothetical protein